MNSRRRLVSRRRRFVALVALAAVGLSACGGSDSGTEADTSARTIAIDMHDNSFSPSAVTVKKGEKVSFVFTNKGTVQHDAYVGTAMEQDSHEAEMRDEPDNGGMAGMDHGGSSVDYGVTVKPGKSDEITTTFADKGEQIIGCHEPGHYAGGMKVIVTVE